VWYEHVTGDSLDGLSLAEQRERVDVIERGDSAYTMTGGHLDQGAYASRYA